MAGLVSSTLFLVKSSLFWFQITVGLIYEYHPQEWDPIQIPLVTVRSSFQCPRCTMISNQKSIKISWFPYDFHYTALFPMVRSRSGRRGIGQGGLRGARLVVIPRHVHCLLDFEHMKNHLLEMTYSQSGWWWLEHEWMIFPIILGMSSSQLTFTPSFFRAVGQPPTSQ